MKFQKLEIDHFYKAAQNFKDLGTGRERKKVLVGDSDDARTSNFLFVANIRSNWPSWSEIRFTNGEVLYLPSATIRGKRVYVFFWNELTEDLWLQQIERIRLLEWFEAADRESTIAMGELIAEQTGSGRKICRIPEFAVLNLDLVQKEIRKLGLSQLRELTSLIDQPVAKDAACTKAA